VGGNRWFRFGDYTFDAAQGLLYRGGQRLRLTPKLIALLALLVERRGEVVSRAEIVRRLWPDTIVEEGGLPRNISMLRKQLDTGDGTCHIENIPKRGYRFAVAVIEVDSPASGAPPVAIKRWWRHPAATLVFVAAIASLALTATRAPKQHAIAAPIRMIPLTNHSAALPILSASISPDGKSLAYVETSGSTATAYVSQLHSPRVQALRSLPGVEPSAIRWYSDNTRVLLSGLDPGSRNQVAWSVSMQGGPPTEVLRDACQIALSRDGRQMAFYRNRNQIWLADGAGESQHLFATAPGSDRFRLLPQFSADGTHLLVGRVTRLPYSPVIEAHRLSDGQVTPIFDPGGRAVFDMLLLPSGELLVSVLVGYDGSEVLSMRVDFARRPTSPETLLRFDDTARGMYASADGRHISVVRDHAQSDVYVGSLDEAGLELTNVRRLTLDDGWDRPSSWLDDGTILFHSNRLGRRGIYKQQIDDPHAEPLVVDEHENLWPVVTPDRQWLWYVSLPGGEFSSETQATLMRQPLAGGPIRAFNARANSWRDLRCARNGTCVRVELQDNESIFYSFDPDDGSGRELVRTPWIAPFAHFSWDLSPEGKRLAFVDRRSNVIGLVDLEVKTPRRTEVRVEGYQALQGVSWDAHGTGLYVACYDEDDSSTLHVSLDGKTTLLRHQPHRAAAWAKPSADGRHLLLADSTKAGNVWLFERAAGAEASASR